MAYETKAVFDRLSLNGKSVLDVGAFNGGFSIEASRRGAAKVVAVDHMSWNNRRRARQAFDLAVRATGLSNIAAQDVDLDAPQLTLSSLGIFDIVLFLGVFYHLRDPLAALRELSSITSEVMVVETHLVFTENSRPMMVYYPGAELGNNPSNWWGPNRQCMIDLLRMHGFTRISYTDGFGRTRGIFHAWKGSCHA